MKLLIVFQNGRVVSIFHVGNHVSLYSRKGWIGCRTADYFFKSSEMNDVYPHFKLARAG